MEKNFYDRKKEVLLNIKEGMSSHFDGRVRRIESGEINKYTPAYLTLLLLREKGCSVSDEEIDSIALRCGYNPYTLKNRYRGWIARYEEELHSKDNQWFYCRWGRCWWYQLKELEDAYAGEMPNHTTKENTPINWEQRRWELASGIFLHYSDLTNKTCIEMADGFIKEYEQSLNTEG